MVTKAGQKIAENSFINAKDLGFMIRFQEAPRGITENKAASYQENQIVGRSHPIFGYASSNARQISFTTSYTVTGGPKIGGEDGQPWTAEQVAKVRNQWQQLGYPQYQGVGVAPPTRVDVILGTRIRLRNAVCQDVSISHDDEAGWTTVGGAIAPRSFEVSATFAESEPLSVGAREFPDLNRYSG